MKIVLQWHVEELYKKMPINVTSENVGTCMKMLNMEESVKTNCK